MKYGLELKHGRDCKTCRKCADSAIVAATWTNALDASTFSDDCFATAFQETENDYAAVWA